MSKLLNLIRRLFGVEIDSVPAAEVFKPAGTTSKSIVDTVDYYYTEDNLYQAANTLDLLLQQKGTPNDKETY